MTILHTCGLPALALPPAAQDLPAATPQSEPAACFRRITTLLVFSLRADAAARCCS